MGKRKKSRLGLSLITIFLLGIVFTYFLYEQQLKPLSAESTEQIYVTIPSNATVEQIGQLLEDEGLIRSGAAFYYYVRFNAEEFLKAGEYALSPSMALPEIVQELQNGKPVLHTFTIPEGFSIKQITKLLTERNFVKEDLFHHALAFTPLPYDYIEDTGDINRLEGFLFPATYRVARNISEEELVKMLVARFDQEVTAEVRQRADELGMTIKEVVTLASIIEREAVIHEERPIISAVFHNRLNSNRRLEACSTIQYLLDEPREKLYLQDLEIQSPYNTYRNNGLPPGPIASPGILSFNAALYPSNVDYLYFVAKGQGYHHFSRTFEEHNRAVARYVN
ncbi:endolytic transglycosylase MltG [Heliorestis acidaminivorans]|uniref:Endolytic murein transglycosylase n=1 Tax=Heliorestis acidaminivorans TaxID=553427 RepID=A0A6I0EZT7_9FIRM|nr:endolytic transglycosylase MltG [Heliorestis acidaminivorans]KAB2951284.1 endolytic transglycosylase MltG [Heliorestis acidaminivorans]